MKKKRIFNVASMLLNAAIVIFTVHCVINIFRVSIMSNDGTLEATGWIAFRYFTVLSNVLMALVSLVFIVFNVKNAVNDTYEFPRWALMMKLSATVAVAVTFTTCVVFLGPIVMPLAGYTFFDLFVNENFFMHLFTPVLAMAAFVFFEKVENFRFVETLYGLIPTAVYSAVYMPMVLVGEENGGWPDFYGFTFGGIMWVIPLSLIAMYGMTFGLSVALRASQKAFFKKISVE